MDVEVAVNELRTRVEKLEAAQSDTTTTLRWVVAKLGGIAAQQDEHTLQLERIDSRLDKMDGRLSKVETGLDALRRDMPSIVADAMREVLNAGKSE